MSSSQKIFSAEPLPVAPKVEEPEIESFHRKVLDYLRRLAGKLDKFVGSTGDPGLPPIVEAICCWMTNPHTLTAVYTPIQWVNELWKDSVYIHDPNAGPASAPIGVAEDGLYVILVQLEFSPITTFPADVVLEITDVGSTQTFVPKFGFNRCTVEGALAYTIAVPLPAGSSVKVMVKDGGSNLPGLLATGSRITIMRIADNNTGGTGDPPGSGWDPPGGTGSGDPPSWVLAEY